MVDPIAGTPSRRRPAWLGPLLAVAVVLTLLGSVAVRYEPTARVLRGLEARFPLVSPERRLEQFVLASQRGDTEGMLALVDPAEVSRLGLTPAKLERMLREAASTREPMMLVQPLPEPLNSRQRRFNRWINVELRPRSGVPMPGGRLRAILQAYNTDAGWKIGISNFVYAVDVSRRGMDGRKPRFAALCLKHGVKPELFWPTDARWETLPLPTRAELPGRPEANNRR